MEIEVIVEPGKGSEVGEWAGREAAEREIISAQQRFCRKPLTSPATRW